MCFSGKQVKKSTKSDFAVPVYMVETEDTETVLLIASFIWTQDENSEMTMAKIVKKMVSGEEGTVSEVIGALWVPQFQIEHAVTKRKVVKSEDQSKLWTFCKMEASDKRLDGEIEREFNQKKDVLMSSNFVISISTLDSGMMMHSVV